MVERSVNKPIVAVISGDGIGPEVVEAAIPAIDQAAQLSGVPLEWRRLPFGADHYLKTGETIPEAAVQELAANVDAIFVGALGDPRIPTNEHARDILLGLRFRLDLYVNFRPVKLLHPDLCPLKGIVPPRRHNKRGEDAMPIDFVIFRENTEGLYLGHGRSSGVGTDQEKQIAEDVHTASGVRRILRAAFQWAVEDGRTLVTMSDKSNVIPAHRLWGRALDEVGEEFPQINREHRYVDALAMELVRNPDRFQVIVTNNLFGDILSDLGAGLVGGLGLAPSANLHPGRPGLFEPVHGSAPTIAGKDQANPMAALLTGALMLDDLGVHQAARRLEAAVRAAIAEGVTTPDLGGRATTREVGDWVAASLSR